MICLPALLHILRMIHGDRHCVVCCVAGYGRSSGGITCLIHNNHPTHDIVIAYQDVIPWYLRVYFHTLKIETFPSVPQHIDAVGSFLKPCNFNKIYFTLMCNSVILFIVIGISVVYLFDRHRRRQVVNIYSVSQKSSPLKTFCNIFTQVKYISMKFCQYVASLYLHILTSFGRFILIFNKMALIFLQVPIIFNVFSFKFHQVKSP